MRRPLRLTTRVRRRRPAPDPGRAETRTVPRGGTRAREPAPRTGGDDLAYSSSRRRRRRARRAHFPSVCVDRVRARVRAAAVRLHVAAGAQRRVSAAQGRVGPVRHAARLVERHRRADGRHADISAVGARRPLGPRAQHHADGGALERRDARLRGRDELRRVARRARVRRRRRGRVRQRRRRADPRPLPAASALDAHRRVHGGRRVRLGARHGTGRRRRDATSAGALRSARWRASASRSSSAFGSS
ncbi:major facilitator family transporter domain protein [Burkholderia pseudomallei MSHR435]|nr:major facilitator family transporter domain protein [Burkholderia pseudomallei MSHR435]